MNFLLQIDPKTGKALLEEAPVELSFLQENLKAFSSLDYVLFPSLALALIAILALRTRIREPDKVIFRFGVLTLIVGVLQLAFSIHGALHVLSTGMSQPGDLAENLREGIGIYSMYVGLSLIPIVLSIILPKSQQVDTDNPDNPPENP